MGRSLLRRLHTSFAFRLLAAGLALALLLVAGISAFLLISRDRQTRSVALSNADNRALVARQVLQQFTGASSRAAAQQLAGKAALEQALLAPDPATALGDLFRNSPAAAGLTLPDELLVITGPSGDVLYSAGGTLQPSLPQIGGLASVRAALFDGRTATGLELIAASPPTPAYDTAAPVRVSGRTVGAVVYLAPLGPQLSRLRAITEYPVAFIPAGSPQTIVRGLTSGRLTASSTPADLRHPVVAQQDDFQAVYPAPLVGGGGGDVAGAFVALSAPGSQVTAGYVGVEAPLDLFSAGQRDDELTVLALALIAVLLTALMILLFVERFVQRPVARLERGVARIAGGDYTTDIEVTSHDELGRLAGSVNEMRRQISRYIADIEEARRRLDAAVERLGAVSRALTTTGAGVEALQQAVVDAAAAMGGGGAAAILALRDGARLVTRATAGLAAGSGELTEWRVAESLLQGRAVRVESAPRGWVAGTLVAVPMFYQGEVVGALAVIARAGERLSDGDAQTLAVLANNAAIALENTRLFEQERETVRRLRQLDAMKSDFLATVQHELRTPLTAILGMSDLLEMCWTMWPDDNKLEAVRDIQVAAKTLHDIVETMIDFSLLEADTLGLNPVQAPVRPLVEQAVAAVEQRSKGGLPVPVEVEVAPDVEVFADPGRLEQVMRAVVDNAVKFTAPGGHVWVRASENGRAGMVRLDVVDTGIGIPEEAQPHIFDRFFQVDNTATRRYGGTGMGLALVRRLVDAHGAQVEVSSAVGEGTKMSLHWPKVAAAAAGEARRVAEERGEAV